MAMMLEVETIALLSTATLAVVNAVKQARIPNDFMPLMSFITGLLLTVGKSHSIGVSVSSSANWFDLVLVGGVVVGLGAVGLYETPKRTARAINDRRIRSQQGADTIPD